MLNPHNMRLKLINAVTSRSAVLSYVSDTQSIEKEELQRSDGLNLMCACIISIQ